MKKFQSLLILLSLFSVFARARVYNYADLPVGERAAGMGMTAVASGSDVGDAYVNPAGVADLQSPMIGASVSSYTRVDARTGKFVSLFDSVKDSLLHGGVESTPAFVGGNLNTNGWVWGGGVIMPSTLTLNGTLRPGGDNIVSYSAQSRTAHLLAFGSRRFGNFSHGVSMTVASLNEEERFFELVSINPNVVKNVEYTYSLNALLVGLGTVWDFLPGWRLGASTSLPLNWMGGDGSFADVESGASSSDVRTFDLKKHPFPARFSLGLEWVPTPAWTLASDVHWYPGFERNLAPSLSQGLLDLSAKSIANVNFGVQWRGWSRVGLRAGLFTNLTSSKKKFSRYSTLHDSVNFIGATGAIYFPSPNGSISIGGFFQGGQGRMADVTDADGSVGSVRRSIYIYGAVLGSTYLFL